MQTKKTSWCLAAALFAALLVLGSGVTSCDTGSGGTGTNPGTNGTPSGTEVKRALTTTEANYLYSLHASGNNNSAARAADNIANAFRDKDFTFCRIGDQAITTTEPDGQPPVLVTEFLNEEGTYVYLFTYIVSGYKYEAACNKDFNKDQWFSDGKWQKPQSDRFHSDSDSSWFFFY